MKDWIVSSENFQFRIFDHEDDVLFSSFKDWPVDKWGPYTKFRAIQDAHVAMQENQFFEWPLTEDSDFHLNMVITKKRNPNNNNNVEIIGFTKCRIWGKDVWIKSLAFTQEARGNGYFEEVYLLYKYFCFEVLICDNIARLDFLNQPALTSMRERWNNDAEKKPNDDTRYPKETKEEVERRDFSKVRFQQDEKPYLDKDGKNLKTLFETNQRFQK